MNSAVDKRWLAKDRYSVWPEPGSLLGRKLTAANVTSSHTNLTPGRNTNLTLILDKSSFAYVTQILHHTSYTDLRKNFLWLRLPRFRSKSKEQLSERRAGLSMSSPVTQIHLQAALNDKTRIFILINNETFIKDKKCWDRDWVFSRPKFSRLISTLSSWWE